MLLIKLNKFPSNKNLGYNLISRFQIFVKIINYLPSCFIQLCKDRKIKLKEI